MLRWLKRYITVWLRIERMSALKTYTLLVQNDLLGDALSIQARAAFLDGQIVEVLDTPSGDPNGTLVKVALSEADYAVILEADKFSTERGETPDIAVTEMPPEP